MGDPKPAGTHGLPCGEFRASQNFLRCKHKSSIGNLHRPNLNERTGRGGLSDKFPQPFHHFVRFIKEGFDLGLHFLDSLIVALKLDHEQGKRIG